MARPFLRSAQLLSGGAICFTWTLCAQRDSILHPPAPLDQTETLQEDTPGKQFKFLPGWGARIAAADNAPAERVPVGEKEERGPGNESNFHLLDLETRKRTFFKYEKRVRSLSTPEKIFEYFASIEEEGVKSMSHQDLLRALTAVYPPQDSGMERAGALLGEKCHWKGKKSQELFSLFDTDGDNRISYPEFVLLMTLMSIPVEDAQLVFEIVDVDDNGVVDYDEFMTIINQIQQQTPQGKKDRGGMRTGLKVVDTSKPVGILAKFFGESGKKTLPLQKFILFLKDIHSGFAVLEFNHYDFKHTGHICGWDFARSMCCGVDVKLVDAYLDKIASMDQALGNHLFSQEEFVGFHGLHDSIQSLSTALRFIHSTRGQVGQKEFSSILHKISHYKISPQALALVFEVFSTNERDLNVSAFLDALKQHRKKNALAEDSSGSGLKKSLVQCLHSCLT